MQKAGPSVLTSLQLPRRVHDFRKRQAALTSEGNGASVVAGCVTFPESGGVCVPAGITPLIPLRKSVWYKVQSKQVLSLRFLSTYMNYILSHIFR